jgi:hypothetical protein
MGSHTLNIVNSVDQKKLLDLLKLERLDYYEQLAKQNPTDKANLDGWKARTESVFKFVTKNFPPTAAVVTGGFFLHYWELLEPFIF